MTTDTQYFQSPAKRAGQARHARDLAARSSAEPGSRRLLQALQARLTEMARIYRHVGTYDVGMDGPYASQRAWIEDLAIALNQGHAEEELRYVRANAPKLFHFIERCAEGRAARAEWEPRRTFWLCAAWSVEFMASNGRGASRHAEDRHERALARWMLAIAGRRSTGGGVDTELRVEVSAQVLSLACRLSSLDESIRGEALHWLKQWQHKPLFISLARMAVCEEWVVLGPQAETRIQGINLRQPFWPSPIALAMARQRRR